MKHADGNQSRAAEWLGINRNTLRRKLRRAQADQVSARRRPPAHARADLRLRQDRRRRARARAARRSASSCSPPAAPRSCWPTPACAVTEVAEHTGFPEMLDGRVKTLHPTIHGGLLARRDLRRAHGGARSSTASRTIDLLVVNLYPFEATVAKRRLHARRRDREHRHRRPGDGALGGEELAATSRC